MRPVATHIAVSAKEIPFTDFLFNHAATTDIYTLSLHDALPIWWERSLSRCAKGHRNLTRHAARLDFDFTRAQETHGVGDRKSTRLNSSHVSISYAVFCLKKKKK